MTTQDEAQKPPPENFSLAERLIAGAAFGMFGFAFAWLCGVLFFSLGWRDTALLGSAAFVPFFFIGARWFIAAAFYSAFVNFIVSAAAAIVGILAAVVSALNV